MKRTIDTAIVLKRVNYGESDRVLTLLTKEHGKISVFAKGVRKPKSRLAGGIELLSLSEVGYLEGKSDLKTLTSATLRVHYGAIVKDVQKMNRALEALERVAKLADENAGQEYFVILETYFAALADDQYNEKLTEVWFRLQIMHACGVLGDIGIQGNIKADIDAFRFNYDKQFFETDIRGDFSKNDIKLLKLLRKRSKPVRLASPLGSEESLLQFTRTLYSFNLG